MEVIDIKTTLDITRQNIVVQFCQQFVVEQGDPNIHLTYCWSHLSNGLNTNWAVIGMLLCRK